MNPNAMVLWDKEMTLLPRDNLVPIDSHERGIQMVSLQTSPAEMGMAEKEGSMVFTAGVSDGDRVDQGGSRHVRFADLPGSGVVDRQSQRHDVGLGSRTPSVVPRAPAASGREF
ncbi:hypothetical protein NE237_009325 [Protea cynaroides]|uniref:Uncharacterized protein n=1 Tax=Protea cynaroides TaxID=273540 RepID=A0A9Q0KXL1_9MAGN|nr:hypothetical protein NE237_009325 [Protea cynaroides]